MFDSLTGIPCFLQVVRRVSYRTNAPSYFDPFHTLVRELRRHTPPGASHRRYRVTWIPAAAYAPQSALLTLLPLTILQNGNPLSPFATLRSTPWPLSTSVIVT